MNYHSCIYQLYLAEENKPQDVLLYNWKNESYIIIKRCRYFTKSPTVVKLVFKWQCPQG